MTLIKYIFAYVLGALAAISIGKIVAFSGAVTTIDAWILTLTIVGQDVGDRMVMLVRVLLEETSSEALVGMSYLVGHSMLEEIVKFIAFFIAFQISKPNSIREIVLNGIAVGVGFATMETFGYYSSTALHLMVWFILRAVGHGLFTGVIALLFGMGYFAQMRWIDSGANRGISAWFLRYEKKILQIFWTIVGLIFASLLHAVVNIYASLGGQAFAVIIMMSAWAIFIFFLMRPSAARPYGTIIREVDLLKQIAEAEDDLQSLEKTGEARTIAPVLLPQSKLVKFLKRFAKG
jgi:RsiW-degrading membrane proteinase PrsW (M82 family)